MSILYISKTLIFKFWYHYFKLKYGDRAKLCYTDTDGFIIHIITEDFFEDISNDVVCRHGMIHLIMMKTIKDLLQ